jgi:protein SCO1/2
MMKRPLAVAAVALAAAVAGVLALALSNESRSPALEKVDDEGAYRGSEPPGRNVLPDFSLRNHDGRLVRSDDLRGKIALVTFLDSQCDEACPIIASQVARGLGRLSARERRDSVAVAISTDPAEDTPASVRAFLERQRALGRLLYLTGSEAEMRALWKRFQILSSHESGQDTLHSAPVRVYDRDGVWVSSLHAGVDLTPANLVHDLRVARRG